MMTTQTSFLDLRDPALREELGLRTTATVSERFQRAEVGQFHRGRAETEQLIMELLQNAGSPMTRLEIARAIGRTKTPHFRMLLDSLVANGFVVRSEGNYRGVLMYLYEVAR